MRSFCLTETAPRKEMKTVMKPCPCSETLMFKATTGTLGSAVIVMFFVMIYSYYDLKKAQRNAKVCRPYEPVHEKTNNLHRRKQRRRSASR